MALTPPTRYLWRKRQQFKMRRGQHRARASFVTSDMIGQSPPPETKAEGRMKLSRRHESARDAAIAKARAREAAFRSGQPKKQRGKARAPSLGMRKPVPVAKRPPWVGLSHAEYADSALEPGAVLAFSLGTKSKADTPAMQQALRDRAAGRKLPKLQRGDRSAAELLQSRFPVDDVSNSIAALTIQLWWRKRQRHKRALHRPGPSAEARAAAVQRSRVVSVYGQGANLRRSHAANLPRIGRSSGQQTIEVRSSLSPLPPI